jgi:hypothetical protein
MKRQIVHVSAWNTAIIALCDDGTVWECFRGDWQQFPPIPQDPEAPEVTELRKFVEGNGDDRP